MYVYIVLIFINLLLQAVSNELSIGFRAYIDGLKVVVQPSESHGNLKVVGANKYINLIGTDVLRSHDLFIDWCSSIRWGA